MQVYTLILFSGGNFYTWKAHFHIMLVVQKQNQSIKEKERRGECVFFKSTSWGPGLQNSIANQEDKHKICAFSLQGATGEWPQWRAAIGSSLLGVLSVIVTNANSLGISLAKLKTHILIFSWKHLWIRSWKLE